MKWLAFLLIIVLSYLQYRIWFGEGSASDLIQLQNQIEEQKADNVRLQTRNRLLTAEVEALKNTNDAIEERARIDLGMVKKGETFFMVVEPTHNK